MRQTSLFKLHWTQTIFLPACWRRALGIPLVIMTSRLQLQQLEVVPAGVPCSSGWRGLGTAAGIKVA